MWLNLPIIDSSAFIVTVSFSIALSMSRDHSVHFSSERNTLNSLVSITQPNTVFLSSSSPSALCLVMLIIGFLFVASSVRIGLNKVSRTRGTECAALSGKSFRSSDACIKLSMKLSVTIFLGGKSTYRLSALPNGMYFIVCVSGFSFMLNDDLSVCGDHEGSDARSCAMSAAASLIVLNIGGAGDDPKGSLVSKYAMSFRTVMHVIADDISAWMRLYAASRSVLLSHILVLGCLRRMS